MIPHAITNTGSCVELWSQLKAIQHALGRAAHGAVQLTPLDRELLSRLVNLLRNAVTDEKHPAGEWTAYFESLTSAEAEHSLELDLREHLRNVPEFEGWLSTQKLGVDKRIQRLITALQGYIDESDRELIASRLPEEEFRVLGAIVSRLLLQIESALNA